MVRREVFARSDDDAIPIPRLLFAVLGPPVLWALHLAASYFVVTLDCISAWDSAAWALAALTALATAGIAAAGWTGWRLRRARDDGGVDPDARDWTRFVLLIGMAGAILFGLVVVAEGVAPAFVSLCA